MARWIIILAVTVLCSWSLAGRGRAAEFAADMGSLEIGGSARLEQRKGDLYENDEGESNSLIQILPRVGYFAIPGFAFGVTFEYVKEGFNAGADVTTFGIGPNVGIYLGAGRSRVMPFATAGFYRKDDMDVDVMDVMDDYGYGPRRKVSLSGTKLGLSLGLTGFLF